MRINARKPVLITVAAIAILGVGCATIMHGTSQDVGISSKPSGARVLVDNIKLGKTPLVAKLSRKDNHTIKIAMKGYQPFEATITRSTSGWVAGNILFGGLIGLAIDAISGGMYKLKPEEVAAVLDKQAMGLIPEKDTIYIAVVLEPEPSWEKVATLQPQSLK